MMETACLIRNVSNTHYPAAAMPITRSQFMGSQSVQFSRVDLKGKEKSSAKRFVMGIRAGDIDRVAGKKVTPYTNYAVPLDNLPASSCITRPLVEILRDLNKRVPDKVIKLKQEGGVENKYIPW
eukprot:Gb_08811 [translate_table: standard]